MNKNEERVGQGYIVESGNKSGVPPTLFPRQLRKEKGVGPTIIISLFLIS